MSHASFNKHEGFHKSAPSTEKYLQFEKTAGFILNEGEAKG